MANIKKGGKGSGDNAADRIKNAMKKGSEKPKDKVLDDSSAKKGGIAYAQERTPGEKSGITYAEI